MQLKYRQGVLTSSGKTNRLVWWIDNNFKKLRSISLRCRDFSCMVELKCCLARVIVLHRGDLGYRRTILAPKAPDPKIFKSFYIKFLNMKTIFALGPWIWFHLRLRESQGRPWSYKYVFSAWVIGGHISLYHLILQLPWNLETSGWIEPSHHLKCS